MRRAGLIIKEMAIWDHSKGRRKIGPWFHLSVSPVNHVARLEASGEIDHWDAGPRDVGKDGNLEGFGNRGTNYRKRGGAEAPVKFA